jgi:hypothetical protein
MQPEMIALGIRIIGMGDANPLQLAQKIGVVADGISQLFPIRALAACNYVVNRGKRQFLMI